MNLFRSITCAILALGFLSACSGGGGGGAASGGTAREYTRDIGDVTVTPNVGIPTTYTATQIVTISNDDAGASRLVSAWQNTSGSLATAASALSGYQVQVTLTTTAESEQQARDLLETIHIRHRDGVGGSTLYLEHDIDFDQVSGSNIQRKADILASLPPGAEHELYQGMTSGTNASSGLGGPLAHLATTSGNATLSGNWDDAVLTATSGNIDVTVAAAVGAVYDVEAQVTSGNTTITVAGTSAVGEQTQDHKHYRSPDYASGSPQIDVYGRATSGNVTIHD